MFNLSQADLNLRILGCGDGPASFNSEMTAAGRKVVSIDPIYAFSREQIKQRVEETYDPIISQVKQDSARYVWQYFGDADALGRARLKAMENFLGDFEAGLAAGRYMPGALPALNFTEGQFQLSLCSHLLFLYSEQLSLDFHLLSITELLRVSAELRIFPLLALDCQPSPYLEPVQEYFSAQGYSVEICPVPYEFQRGGHQMMRVSRKPIGHSDINKKAPAITRACLFDKPTFSKRTSATRAPSGWFA
jgi:hypothetical protein